MTRNLKKHKGNQIIPGHLVWLLIAAFVLALPLTAAAADQVQQLLQQTLRDGYQDHDRDRILDGVQECLKAGIPSDTVASLVEQAARSSVDAQHMEKMLQQMTKTGESNLPTGPVAAKAMEGMVKQVQAKNIVRAMERVRERMEFASGQMKRLEGLKFSEQERDQAIIGTADALAAGMERKHVRQVYGNLEKEAARERTQSTVRKQTMASIEAMKRIRGYGVPSEQVASVCGEMIQNRYTEREMEQVMGEYTLARNRNRNMKEFSKSVEGNMGDGGQGPDGGSSGGNTGSGGSGSSQGSGGGSGGSDGSNGGGGQGNGSGGGGKH